MYYVVLQHVICVLCCGVRWCCVLLRIMACWCVVCVVIVWCVVLGDVIMFCVVVRFVVVYYAVFWFFVCYCGLFSVVALLCVGLRVATLQYIVCCFTVLFGCGLPWCAVSCRVALRLWCTRVLYVVVGCRHVL